MFPITEFSRVKPTVFAFLAVGAFLPSLHAQKDISSQYEFVSVQYPGAAVSFPLGINARRQMVGTRYDENGVAHGFFYEDGKFADIDYPGAVQTPGGGTFVGGINDEDDVVGLYVDNDGFQHGFIRSFAHGSTDPFDGNSQFHYRPINVPGAAQTKDIPFELGPGLGTAAIGINNLREIVGIYASDVHENGFKRVRKKFTTIDHPRASHETGGGTTSFAINDLGEVAGSYLSKKASAESFTTRGFLLTDRGFEPIYVPGSKRGGFGTQANGVNKRGNVVGVFTDRDGAFHGMLWKKGTPYQINYPGAPFSECHSINQQGDITGAYILDLTGENYLGFAAFRKSK